MLQHRKKDFLIRLIEEMFKKMMQIKDDNRTDNPEKLSLINDCYTFFTENLGITENDDSEAIIRKIEDFELLEQYAKLLLTDYEIKSKDRNKLTTALEIIDYLQATDKTYSWDRTVMREDILRHLDENLG